MADRRVECLDVTMPAQLRLGAFANAFRTVHDSGNEFFLDFIHYSESEKIAQVVARVRVQDSFMAAIRDRLSSTLEEITAQKGKQITIVLPTGSEEPN